MKLQGLKERLRAFHAEGPCLFDEGEREMIETALKEMDEFSKLQVAKEMQEFCSEETRADNSAEHP